MTKTVFTVIVIFNVTISRHTSHKDHKLAKYCTLFQRSGSIDAYRTYTLYGHHRHSRLNLAQYRIEGNLEVEIGLNLNTHFLNVTITSLVETTYTSRFYQFYVLLFHKF